MKIKSWIFALLSILTVSLSGFDINAYRDVTVEKYPNANSVLLLDIDTIKYKHDGSYVNDDNYYTKILTDKGVKENREIPLHYNQFYGSIEVLEFAIIKENGKVEPIDVSKNSEVIIDSEQISQNIFDPNNKILKLSVPQLEIGDILHLNIREINKISRIKNVFSTIKVLQSSTPILLYELTIEGPKDFPLQNFRIKDEVAGTVKFEEKIVGDKVVYHYLVKDVPMLIPEGNAPPMYQFSQRFLGSTAKNWEEISSWYYNLCLPHLEKKTPEMVAKVEELTKSCKSEQEKIMAIFQFVSQKIRYMGITTETEAPGYEPHDVDITFNNRYGVCRDKAALLVTMLQIAGFESYPVLFYAGYPKDEEVPNNYFNHAITAVKLGNEYLLMDSTDETTKEFLPSYLANNSYLVANKKGESLKRSKIIDSKSNEMEIINNCQYDAKKNLLSGKTDLIFHGINDIIYRNALSRWPKDYDKQFFGSILRKMNSNAELLGIKITPLDIRNMNEVLKIEIAYEIKNFLEKSEDKIQILPSLELGNYLGATSMILGDMGLEKRQFPMELFSTSETNEVVNLKLLNAKMAIDFATFDKIDNKLIGFDRVLTKGVDELIIKSHFALKNTLIYPTEYLEAKENLKKIEADKAKQIFLTTLNDPNNEQETVINKDYLTIDFQDRYNWSEVIERELVTLNYASIKDNAELQIEFNPIWEKLELIDAYVKHSDGSSKKIAAEEINIMDQEINAPAYSTGKIFTINFPNVQVGSTIYYKIKITKTNQHFFSKIINFSGFNQIKDKQLIFVNPINELRYSAIPAEIQLEQSGNQWKFFRTNISKTPREIATPPLWMFTPTLFFATETNASFAEKIIAEVKAKAITDDIIKNKTLEIVKDCKNKQEKVLAIRDFVAKNIRLINIPMSNYPLIFSTASEVLSRGYATSADRAILLIAMLNVVDALDGTELIAASNLYLIHDENQDKLGEFLQNIFGSILIFKKGEFVLNDSNQYGLLNATRFYSKGILNLSQKGRLERFFYNIIPPAIKQDFQLKLSSDNSAEIEIRESYLGSKVQEINQYIAELTIDEKNRFVSQLVNNISMRAKLVDNSFGTQKDDKSFVVKYKVKIADFVNQSGEYFYFELPEFSSFAEAIRLANRERQNPYYIDNLKFTNIEYLITFDAPVELINKSNTKIDYKSYQFGLNYLRSLTNKTLKVRGLWILQPSLLDEINYNILCNLNEKINKNSQKTIIFTKK